MHAVFGGGHHIIESPERGVGGHNHHRVKRVNSELEVVVLGLIANAFPLKEKKRKSM